MSAEARAPLGHRELLLLAVLFGALAIVCTGVQMGSALFPALSRLTGVPVGTVTLLTSVWAFTGLLSPLFGPPSDRYGHGVFVLAGLGVFALGNLLCATASSFPALLAFQALVGLGNAVCGFSIFAVVGDAFPYAMRARAMGLIRLAVALSALLGVPAAAVIAGRATAHGSFAAVGGVSVAVLAAALVLLPRLPRGSLQNDPGTSASRQAGVGAVIRRPSVPTALLATMVYAMMPTGVFIYLAAWLEQSFRLSQPEVGLAFSTIGVGALLGDGLAAAWTDRLGKKRSAVLGLLAMSVSAVLLPHVRPAAAALVGVAIFATVLEFGDTGFSALLTELAPEGRGTLMSLASLANGLGTGLVPLALRPLWEQGGYGAITLVLGVVGLAGAGIVGFAIRERDIAPVRPQSARRPAARR